MCYVHLQHRIIIIAPSVGHSYFTQLMPAFRHRTTLAWASMVNTRLRLRVYEKSFSLSSCYLFCAHSLAEHQLVHTHTLTHSLIHSHIHTLRRCDGFQCQFYTSSRQSRFAGDSNRSAFLSTALHQSPQTESASRLKFKDVLDM